MKNSAIKKEVNLFLEKYSKFDKAFEHPGVNESNQQELLFLFKHELEIFCNAINDHEKRNDSIRKVLTKISGIDFNVAIRGSTKKRPAHLEEIFLKNTFLQAYKSKLNNILPQTVFDFFSLKFLNGQPFIYSMYSAQPSSTAERIYPAPQPYPSETMHTNPTPSAPAMTEPSSGYNHTYLLSQLGAGYSQYQEEHQNLGIRKSLEQAIRDSEKTQQYAEQLFQKTNEINGSLRGMDNLERVNTAFYANLDNRFAELAYKTKNARADHLENLSEIKARADDDYQSILEAGTLEEAKRTVRQKNRDEMRQEHQCYRASLFNARFKETLLGQDQQASRTHEETNRAPRV